LSSRAQLDTNLRARDELGSMKSIPDFGLFAEIVQSAFGSRKSRVGCNAAATVAAQKRPITYSRRMTLDMTLDMAPDTALQHVQVVSEARQALHEVRGALAEVYASAGADPAEPQGVARRYNLNRNLTWKLSRVLRSDEHPGV
jgi:hypothetical protein